MSVIAQVEGSGTAAVSSEMLIEPLPRLAPPVVRTGSVNSFER
jgi:hypothetical protein